MPVTRCSGQQWRGAYKAVEVSIELIGGGGGGGAGSDHQLTGYAPGGGNSFASLENVFRLASSGGSGAAMGSFCQPRNRWRCKLLWHGWTSRLHRSGSGAGNAQSAPSDHYGAGGGGAGADDNNPTWGGGDGSGYAGTGGAAAIRETLTLYLAVGSEIQIQVGSGGGGGDDYNNGGRGANGYVRIECDGDVSTYTQPGPHRFTVPNP